MPTKDLSVQDLAQLKKDDAFAFYSIPAAKQAALQHGVVDLRRLSEASFSAASAVADSTANSASNGSEDQTVERQKRISFECYPDIAIMPEDLEAALNDGGLDEEEEDNDRRDLQADHQALGQ